MHRNDAKVGDKVWVHFLFVFAPADLSATNKFIEFPEADPCQVKIVALDQQWRAYTGLWRVAPVNDPDRLYIVFPVDCDRTKEECIAAYRAAASGERKRS